MANIGIGIIGCGKISGAYFKTLKLFPQVQVVAAADLDVARAAAACKEHGVGRPCSVDELLADPAIEAVVNLTIPQAHAEIDLKALRAGKHVYSEKPLALDRAEGRAVLAEAAARKLRLSCAPDTVLGSGTQSARALIDGGTIGRVVGGHAFMQCPGHESWHPAPEFYYLKGGGPMFDMGPYYLHCLINLLGPVQRVSGATRTTWSRRTITSQPKAGTVMTVEVPTHVVALLEFVSGAVVTLTTSFDVQAHGMPNIELYGEQGSLRVGDPNGFGNAPGLRRRGDKEWVGQPLTHPYKENSRGIGVVEMVLAARAGRPHRASAELAQHALDIMQAVHEAADAGRSVQLSSTCERPAAMVAGQAEYAGLV